MFVQHMWIMKMVHIITNNIPFIVIIWYYNQIWFVDPNNEIDQNQMIYPIFLSISFEFYSTIQFEGTLTTYPCPFIDTITL